MGVRESEERLPRLDYGRPAPLDYSRPRRREPWIRLSRTFLVGLGLAAIAIVFGVMGWVVPAVISFLGVCVCWYFLPLYRMYREATAHRRMSEAEYDAGFTERAAKKEEMLAIASRIYARGPIGRWRWAEVSDAGYVEAGPAIVKMERELEFEIGGKGRYSVRGMEIGVKAETLFEYAFEREGVLRVRLISPRQEEWASVWFEFDVALDVWHEPELTVCFKGVNPLRGALQDYWPFFGELMRVSGEGRRSYQSG